MKKTIAAIILMLGAFTSAYANWFDTHLNPDKDFVPMQVREEGETGNIWASCYMNIAGPDMGYVVVGGGCWPANVNIRAEYFPNGLHGFRGPTLAIQHIDKHGKWGFRFYRVLQSGNSVP